MPGYFLNRQEEAHDHSGRNWFAESQVQMDLFHCQVSRGIWLGTFASICRDLGLVTYRLRAFRNVTNPTLAK